MLNENTVTGETVMYLAELIILEFSFNTQPYFGN